MALRTPTPVDATRLAIWCCLALGGVLSTASAGYAQPAGTFPDQPFNGLQITYSVGGADITDTKDVPGFTTERVLDGTLKPGSLTVSGSASVGAGFGAMVTVTVKVGDKEQTFTKDLVRSDGNQTPSTTFNVSVPVAPGAGGSFEIRMDGRYSMGGGHRGLVVRGGLAGFAAPKPPPQPPAKPPARTETFRVSGTVRDANGRPLPCLQLLVRLGSASEKAVPVNEQGFFEHQADLPVPLSDKDREARIRGLFHCVRDGTTWFQLVMFPRPAALADGIMAVHKFTLDEGNRDIQKDVDFGTSEWADRANTNISDPGKLKKISVIFRNVHDAWAFAVDKLKVKLAGNVPLLVEIESNAKTVFDYDHRTIRLEDEYTLNVPSNAFVHHHEFGHYVQYTAYGNRYVENAAGESDPRNKAHGGYANDDTGDSFIEGFATYYAGLVAKHRGIAPSTTGAIGTFGSLEDPWKVWEKEGKDEEFAFASVFWDLDTKAGLGHAGVWDVLKHRRATFFLYYEAFLKAHPGKKAAIDDAFLRHGVYSITVPGNAMYDSGEAFIDLNASGAWDPGEPFVDYSVGPSGQTSMAATPDAVIGQSANYQRVDKRYSTFRFPNSFLRLEGQAPSRLRVQVARRDGSLTYDYTAPVYGGRLHLPLLPEAVDANVSVRADAGVNQNVFYSKSTSELRRLFDATRSSDALDSVAVPAGAGMPPEDPATRAPVSPSPADPADFLPPADDVAVGGEGTGTATTGSSGGGGQLPAATRVSWPGLALAGLVGLVVVLAAAIVVLQRRRARASVAVRLDVLGHDGLRRSIEMKTSRISVGRSGDNDVVIADPEVSGHHLELVVVSGAVAVRDLGSANGTRVNASDVREQMLQSGDDIELGSTTIRVVF